METNLEQLRKDMGRKDMGKGDVIHLDSEKS